ncbi:MULTISPECIES: PTS mannose/fructose/sorbose/N-acetylgalactosamine transporter subunit IIC [unclassified Fusobacterium]|uniref:PTS mannose/fructose/sorbose/N-acetylgalactosamine transporter subunit IIC n=2 Tax=Fusobacterium TaxID=848 RepID=UPI0025BDB4C6|nr:PTS mannose/fructose/sorbose/N-acetylgalactosamine transporter subunit IIC [Fusobacterium sp.]
MITAFLLGLIAFVSQCEYALGTSLICRPIVTGLLTGIVMGDIKAGVIMGATLELAFIGSFSVGGSLPPDVITGGILAIAFSIASKSGVETVLLLALPIATFTLIMKNLYNGIIIPMLLHKADDYASEGNCKGIERMHLLSGFGLSLLLGVITFVAFYLGGDVITNLLKMIPTFVQRGLEVATGIIPALGFAMLARLLLNKELVVYLFLGFFIAAYTGIPLTGIAIFGAILAIILVNVSSNGVGVRETVSNTQGGELEDEDF